MLQGSSGFQRFPLETSCYSDRFPFIYHLWFFSSSFEYTFFVLYTQCFNCNMLWGFVFLSHLFGVLCISCICMGIPLLSLRMFSSMILSILLTWDFSPSLCLYFEGLKLSWCSTFLMCAFPLFNIFFFYDFLFGSILYFWLFILFVNLL